MQQTSFAPPPMSMHEMCAYVVDTYLWDYGVAPWTPEELYNYSPTGELAYVFDAFWAAWSYRNKLKMVVDLRQGPRQGDITWETGGPGIRHILRDEDVSEYRQD